MLQPQSNDARQETKRPQVRLKRTPAPEAPFPLPCPHIEGKADGGDISRRGLRVIHAKFLKEYTVHALFAGAVPAVITKS